jgi:hypothetical protein
VFKIKKKLFTFLDGSVAKIKYNAEIVEMDDEELYIPDDVLKEATAAGYQIFSKKSELCFQKKLEKFTSE